MFISLISASGVPLYGVHPPRVAALYTKQMQCMVQAKHSRKHVHRVRVHRARVQRARVHRERVHRVRVHRASYSSMQSFESGVQGCTGPIPHHGVHLALVLGAEEHATWPPVQFVVIEAGPAHRGGVHDGRHLRKVVQQHPVEQRLVPILPTPPSA